MKRRDLIAAGYKPQEYNNDSFTAFKKWIKGEGESGFYIRVCVLTDEDSPFEKHIVSQRCLHSVNHLQTVEELEALYRLLKGES